MSNFDVLLSESKEWLGRIQSYLRNDDDNPILVNASNKIRKNLSDFDHRPKCDLSESKIEVGSFDNVTLEDLCTDFASQMFWHIAKKTLLEDNGNRSQDVDDRNTKSTNNTPRSNWYSNCKGTGTICPSDHEVDSNCDCGLGEENLSYTRNVIAQLEQFLARLLPSFDCKKDGESNRKVYEAVSIHVEIAKMGLNYLDNLLTSHRKDYDSKFSPLATAISYYSTLLVQANLTVLQMAWHRNTKRQTVFLKISGVGENKVSEFVAKAGKYTIPNKKFIQTHSKVRDVIEETFRAQGLSTTFSKWPLLYIGVIWLSKLFNEENGGNSSIRFISGLSDSLVMSDWFNTGTSDADDGSTKPFWIFLALIFKAAKETFDMRMNLFGDAATAVRGIIQGAHFETKNKIEHSLESDSKILVDAVVASKLGELPSFKSWLTMCFFDSGLSGILGCDSVNSLTRIREASFSFLFFNDIVDFKRDWSCGEIRNFLIIQCTNNQTFSASSESLGLFQKTIAASIGAFEFMLKNEATFGTANIMAQHCVYPWQIATGRYGMIKTYLLNVGSYLEEQDEQEMESTQSKHFLGCGETIPDILKWRPAIRIVNEENLKGFMHRFDDNFQPILNGEEVLELKYISVDQLRAKCDLYMGVDSTKVSIVDANTNSSLSTELEMELGLAELTHDECKNRLISSLAVLWRQKDAVTVISLTTSISRLTSYFNDQLDTTSPIMDYQKQPITCQRMKQICMEIHLKFVMLLEIYTLAYSRGAPPCVFCCEKLGDWIDETCCETALKFEMVLENFTYKDRMCLLKIILGSCNFSANYMKVPFYELHLRSNLMAVVNQQGKGDANENNSGDKFTF